MPSPDDPTDDAAVLPWTRSAVPAPRPVLHLVVAWFLNEPDRIGHVAALDRACFFGRAAADAHPDPLTVFHEIRPGEVVAAPFIDSKNVSRRQMELEPRPDGTVSVRNVGKRVLFHNGVPVTECVVRAGDTLMLENAVVFLIESRPPTIPKPRCYQGPRFPFGHPDAHGIVGETPAAWAFREELAGAALSGQHVLIVGPSGAGKELAAKVIHALSSTAKGPFVDRNAATLPQGLVDAELFGSAKSYPNPGTPERDGLIGAAHGGTLFLDEIGELPEAQQSHLLRVLDGGGQYQRLGDSTTRRSSFRLVAATNRDPSTLKHDFLARFTLVIDVPGLDERRGDIAFLGNELLARAARQTRGFTERFFEGQMPKLDPFLVEVLLRHPYRLHTRELDRLLGVALRSSRDPYIALTDEAREEISEAASDAVVATSDEAAAPTDREPSPDQITLALRECGNNVTRAAEWLGINRFKMLGGNRRRCVFLSLLVAASAVAAETRAEPRLGVSGRGALITDEWLPSGWWLEPGVRVDVSLSSVFGAAFEGGLALSSSSIENSLNYHDIYEEEDDVSSRLLLGLPLRAALVWRPGRVFSLELGGIVGLAWSQSDSTQCGERDAEIDPMLGVYFGPAFHFGAEDEIAIGAHVQALVPGQLRCTSSEEDPVTFALRPSWFDDDEPNPMIVGQLVYSFGR